LEPVGFAVGFIYVVDLLKSHRTVLERSTIHIDTLLTYCRSSMHDTGLLDYMEFFKVRRVYFSRITVKTPREATYM